MSDTESAATPPQQAAAPARRRRMVTLAALAAALLALAGGVAAGVAAVVSRPSPSPAPSAPGGASLYFPISGGAAAPAPMPGGGGGVVAGASAPQAALSVNGAGGPGVATSSIAYPFPGTWCNGTGPAAASGPGITATGLAQVNLPVSPQTAQTLSAGVQSNGDSDVATALSDAQQRLTAIRDALRSAGVPDAQISQQGLNVYANGGPKPSNVNVYGNLSATITDASILDRALRAVVAAGASNVSVWSSGGEGNAQPDQASLQSGITRATSAAKSSAQAEAQAAGVSLGALESVQSQPPSICGWSPSGAQMVVAVTLTYAVK